MIDLISKLAKTSKWQSLLALSKDLKCIQLFDNVTDFTYIQLLFLSRMYFYHNANVEIEMGNMPSWAYDKDIYIEAYNEYKKKKEKKQLKDTTKKVLNTGDKGKNKNTSMSTGFKIIFE